VHQTMRAAVLATIVGIAFTAGGSEPAAAEPVYNTSPFDIVNKTNYDLVFWDYSTTDTYPQSGPDHGNRAKPGQKFTFALRQMEGSRQDKRYNGRTTLKANFHTFNAAGTDTDPVVHGRHNRAGSCSRETSSPSPVSLAANPLSSLTRLAAPSRSTGC
jgi:hypothetical protein